MMPTRESNIGRVSITDQGVLLHPPAGKIYPTRRIAYRIGLLALVTVEGTTIKFVDIGFIDCIQRFVRVTMSPSEFAELRRFKATLLDHGYAFPRDPDHGRMLHAELLSQQPLWRRHVLHRQGWYENRFIFAGEPVRVRDRTLSF